MEGLLEGALEGALVGRVNCSLRLAVRELSSADVSISADFFAVFAQTEAKARSNIKSNKGHRRQKDELWRLNLPAIFPVLLVSEIGFPFLSFSERSDLTFVLSLSPTCKSIESVHGKRGSRGKQAQRDEGSGVDVGVATPQRGV